jgi:hypothetical protein
MKDTKDMKNASAKNTSFPGPVKFPYFTLSVPHVPNHLATGWHPTDSTGPFAILQRGAFKTFEEALVWGRDHLGGMPYSVKEITE